MSIYLAKKKLLDLLSKGKLEYNIKIDTIRHVAEIPGKGVLEFSDYNEEELEKLVKKNKKIYVDIEFWNYNYCSYNNINPVILDDIIDNINFFILNGKEFSEGNITILILLHELLTNIYLIPTLDEFKKYLEKLKIENKIILNFLTKIEYKLPLVENYLHLILKVFDEETIYDFLFRECCYFRFEEYKIILENYTIKDIHLASYYIHSHFKDKVEFLKYTEMMIDYFDKKIDPGETIIYNKNNDSPLLGYYLMTLKLDNKIESLYYRVMRKYLDKFGSLKIKIYSDPDMSSVLENRKKEIEEYFDRS